MLNFLLSVAVAGVQALSPVPAQCRFPAVTVGGSTLDLAVVPVPDRGGRLGHVGLRLLIEGNSVLAEVAPVPETAVRDWLVRRTEPDGRMLVLALNADGSALLVRQWPGVNGAEPRVDRRAGACALDAAGAADWLPS